MSVTILVDRLLDHYDPFSGLGINEETVRTRLFDVRTQRHFMDREDTLDWHIGRIAHFVQLFWEDEMPDPIEIDAVCDRGHIYGPTVVDGHHRLCAAKIANAKKIKAIYGGRIDVRDFLTGRRKTYPVDAW